MERRREEQRVDGKINFPSEHCAPAPLRRRSSGPMDGRTDEQSKIDDRLLHFLSTTFPQSPITMDERTAICYLGGSSQSSGVAGQSSLSLWCTFRPFLVLSIPLSPSSESIVRL